MSFAAAQETVDSAVDNHAITIGTTIVLEELKLLFEDENAQMFDESETAGGGVGEDQLEGWIVRYLFFQSFSQVPTCVDSHVPTSVG